MRGRHDQDDPFHASRHKERSTVGNLQKWLDCGGRPNRVARILNRCWAALRALGVAPDYLVTLEVPDRRPGRIVSLPLVMVVVGGERYLVSMLGEEVNRVRNMKAARATSPYAMVVARRCVWKRLRQIVAPILKAYLKR